MILEYDLQFFAAEGQGGEKTEPATEKKLSDARKEGQVAKSREIANGLGLLTVFLVLKIWVGHMGYQFINVFSVIYGRIPEVVTFWHGNMPQQDTAVAFRQMLLQAIIIMAPILLLGLVVAFLSDVIQVGWKPTGKPLQPKFSKLNPLSGFKRIFSVLFNNFRNTDAKAFFNYNNFTLGYKFSVYQNIDRFSSNTIQLNDRTR